MADSGVGARRRRAPHNGRPTKISENVARAIVNGIVANDLAPGTKLPPEAQMLEQYDVGRASLREALRILEVHGLIVIRPGPGGGPVVAEATSEQFAHTSSLYFHVSRATFRELIEARKIMDPMMARLAAERRDEEVRSELEAALEDMRRALEEDDANAYREASTDFHATVAGISGNRILDVYGRALKDLYYARVVSFIAPVDARRTVADEHEAIAKAIFQGQPAKAERLMRRHVEEMAGYFTAQFPGMLDEIIDWH